MKRFTIFIIAVTILLLFSSVQNKIIAQWNYGQAFSTTAPYLSTLPSAVQNKIPFTYMYDSLHFPYPTNAWFANAIMKQGTFPSFNYVSGRQDIGAEKIFPLPYLIAAYKSGGELTNTKMYGFGYVTPACEFYNASWNPADTTNQINWMSSVYYFFGTLDSASLSKGTLCNYDDLSADFRWYSGTNYMECPVVRGMPYFTMKYQNLRPMFYSPYNAMLTVNGMPIPATPAVNITGTKFKIYFAGAGPNQQLYVLYATSPVTLSFLPNGFTCSTPYNGYLRMAYVTTENADPNAADSTARMNLLDAYANYVPLSGKINASVQSDTTKFNFNFVFTTNSSSDSLLMLSLPHHQDMLTSTTSNILKFKCLRGDMKEVYGKQWNMTENMIPDFSWYAAAGNLSNVPNTTVKWYDTLYSILKADFDTTLGAKYQIPNGTNQPTTSPYGFGKNVCRMARVIVIADELIERYQAVDPGNWRKDTLTYLASNARDTVFNFIKKWVDGQNLVWNPPPPTWAGGENNKLIWDSKYGGIISYLSYMAMDNTNPLVYNYDFGNARYNDHAFHYGYVIYAAAVVAKKKPELFTANSNSYMNKMLDLCRDVGSPASPSSTSKDPYFPMHRHKDWYDGNSWMNGIQTQGAGRDQESVSESATAYYGMYLFGLAMNNENLKNTGKLMLASEIRAFRKYYRTFGNSDPMFSTYNSKHLVVGNLWHSLVISNTYGNLPRYIYGVHMLPFAPFIEKMWDYNFASEVWNKVYTNNQASTLFQDVSLFSTLNISTYPVMTYNLPVQAIAAPDAALSNFQNYRNFAGNFDDGTCKSNCFYGIITRKYAPISIQNIGTEIPASYKMYNAYPNPFNPVTKINFDISKSGFVNISIYDMLGRKINTLVSSQMQAGKYSVTYEPSGNSSGIYFCRFEINGYSDTKKLVLVK